MSALALPALALARRALAAGPALFGEMAARALAPECDRLFTSGYAVPGRGAATYVADPVRGAELLAKHPRFAFRARDGRVFRLLPDNGAIAVEQGGAVGDGAANDQPAIQATIDYAEVVGAREVRFDSARYRIDCPPRLSPAAETHAPDGHPLVVRASLVLRGAAAERTVLDFRAPGGADPESLWQTVRSAATDPAPAVWRGGGLFLLGETSEPAPGNRRIARVELSRLVFQGNRRRTGRHGFPADPATGDGWDVTDKAIWLQDSYAGTIVLTDVDAIGWKGEILYLGGAANAVERLELTRCRLLTGNGSALNPGVDAEIVARDCEFGDCFQAQEETAKNRATYHNCLWRDCDHVGLGGGPANALWGGTHRNMVTPMRDPGRPLPMTVLEGCTFRSCGMLLLASWVSGAIHTVDTPVIVDGNHSHGAVDIDLAVDAWLDQADGINALSLFGPSTLTEQVPGAPAGTYKQPLDRLRFRLRHYRTALAAAQGRQWRGLMWNGYLTAGCRISCEGDFASQTTPNGGADPISVPFVGFAGGEPSTRYTAGGWFIAPPIAGSGELSVAGPVMALEVASDIAVDMTLPRWPGGGPDHGYADGQELRLVKNDGRGAVRFVKDAAPDALVLQETRVLKEAHDWIAFTFNASVRRWEESGFFSAV